MKKVIAIGIFDGVHAGHQQIIATAKLHGDVTVLTFDPHPISVISPEKAPTQLLNIADRILFLKQSGASLVEVINFNEDFSSLTPDQFISRNWSINWAQSMLWSVKILTLDTKLKVIQNI